MHRHGDKFVPRARPIGSRIWNRLARDRGLPYLDAMEISDDEQQGGDDDGYGGGNDQEAAAGGVGAGGSDSNMLGRILREVHATRHQTSERIATMENSVRYLTMRVDWIDRNVRRNDANSDDN